jgi:NitT/TauT family transport system permease protein
LARWIAHSGDRGTDFGIIKTASLFNGPYNDQFQAQLSLSVLPGYTAQTLSRMVAAYFCL